MSSRTSGVGEDVREDAGGGTLHQGCQEVDLHVGQGQGMCVWFNSMGTPRLSLSQPRVVVGRPVEMNIDILVAKG